jgi:hypothetical protein
MADRRFDDFHACGSDVRSIGQRGETVIEFARSFLIARA